MHTHAKRANKRARAPAGAVVTGSARALGAASSARWDPASAVLVALLAAACSAGAPADPPLPGAPGAAPVPPAAGPCATSEAFFSPLRRLTRQEYNRTIRDLLGDDSAPADRFPADEVSGGFGNNAAVLGVSPLLAEKYQEAAEALAARAVQDLGALVGCDPVRTGEEACARAFVERFGARAYRRPLTPTERDRLLAVFAVGRTGGSFGEGIEVTLRAILQAPAFIYRAEHGRPARPGEKLVGLTGHEVATRLSYFLWGTMPDARLFEAAARDALATPAQVAAQARQMLADPRARPAVVEFHRQWLGLAALDHLSKDREAYPEFDAPLAAAMAAETAAFVEDVVFGGAGTLGALLTSTRGFVSPALARLYGVSGGDGRQPVTLPASERAGLLTQAGLLSVHALPDQSSPVHRGKMIREQILCDQMPPQPPNLMVSPPEVDPRRPTRERFAQHAEDPACSGCHRLMDPIGFGFEAYDGIGRFRTSDGGRAVDASGELVDTEDADGPFRGARELADRLAGSRDVRDCAATQWYRFAFGRLEGPGDECSLRGLRAAFDAAGGDVRELLVALTTTEAFLHRPALPGEGGR
jgi:hypothetical protein